MTAPFAVHGFGESPEVALDDVAVRGELPTWLTGSLHPQRTGHFPGGRASLPPLVRRAGHAASLHHQRGAGVVRQPLPRDRVVPHRPRRRSDRLPRVRHRPVPIDVRACDGGLRPAGHRQRQGQHRPGRRALPRPRGDAHPGRVRSGDAAHRRRRGLGPLELRAHDDRASASRRGAPRGHQPRHPLRSGEHLRLPPHRHQGRHRSISAAAGRHDRLEGGARAVVHPLVRHVGAAPGHRRVPARGQPDLAAAVAAPVHRELPVEAVAGYPHPRIRSRDGCARALGGRRSVLRLPPRQRL